MRLRHSSLEQTIFAICNPAILKFFVGELQTTLLAKQSEFTVANGVKYTPAL